MPNRIIREAILSSEKMARKHIPSDARRRIQKMPCVICGIDFDIHCDHIVSLATGGGCGESNLQPLCRDCNFTKKHLRSTEDTAVVIASRGLMHFITSFYRRSTRHLNSYDAPTIARWCELNSKEVAEATRMYFSFCKGRQDA